MLNYEECGIIKISKYLTFTNKLSIQYKTIEKLRQY
nr:MAG TPA_asm: hypothetical protein [Caudoviricetes sp.]